MGARLGLATVDVPPLSAVHQWPSWLPAFVFLLTQYPLRALSYSPLLRKHHKDTDGGLLGISHMVGPGGSVHAAAVIWCRMKLSWLVW